MTSRLANISFDAREPRRLADFWSSVLGWQILEEDEEGVSLGAADGSWPVIDFLTVHEPKRSKNRLHLDLRADGCTTEEELARLKGLGAQAVDIGQGDVSWVVLADPEGNEFCLLATSVQAIRGLEASRRVPAAE